MSLFEPASRPFFLTVVALLLGMSVLLSRASVRIGVPLFLFFIPLGIVLGRAALSGPSAHSYQLSFTFGASALILILFDGGLNTPLDRVQVGIRPALLLATAGIVGTTGLMALGAHLLGFPWTQALLIGAIVSPTDAATVFSILRRSGLQPKKRIAIVLELESGLNDPLAVILTFVLTDALARHHAISLTELTRVPVELVVGAIGGALVGYGGRWLLPRAELPAGGLYPVLTLAFAFFAFGLSATLEGNGFLSVYLCALVLGQAPIPYRSGILRFHDSIAWLSQIVMYLLLGVLVRPTALLKAAPAGLGLGLLLAFVARPAPATLLLLPFGFRWREILYLGWVGLRGAVPIILATYPVLARVPDAEAIFNAVFFIVLISTLVPGATVRWATRFLGIESSDPLPPPVLEIVSTRILQGGEIASFALGPSAAACGATVGELPFPPGSAMLLLIREGGLLAPSAEITLSPGDHVYVLCRPADRPLIHLIFGAPESD